MIQYRPNVDDYAIAIHEAGHAVIGIALGGLVNSITIEQVGDDGGSVEMPVRRMAETAELLTHLAGRAAETELLGQSLDGGAETDMAMVARVADPATVLVLDGIVRQLVRLHAGAIECLARTLVARRTMNMHDIRRAIGGMLFPRATPSAGGP